VLGVNTLLQTVKMVLIKQCVMYRYIHHMQFKPFFRWLAVSGIAVRTFFFSQIVAFISIRSPNYNIKCAFFNTKF
jgi:hypothetical protein